jgi:hypothetical protein
MKLIFVFPYDHLQTAIVWVVIQHLIVIQLAKKFTSFIEAVEFIALSQKPVNGTYPEPVQSNPYRYTLFL